jgi:hypothetical protein
MTALRLTRCDHYIEHGGFYVDCGKVRSAPCSAVCRMEAEAPKVDREVDG